MKNNDGFIKHEMGQFAGVSPLDEDVVYSEWVNRNKIAPIVLFPVESIRSFGTIRLCSYIPGAKYDDFSTVSILK